jgi:hypothetical protein
MKRFEPALMPMAPSALPVTDPEQAWALILKYFPEIPAWPRLPRRSFLEQAELQPSEGFPGVMFEGDHIYIDESWEGDPALDRLYIAYLGNNVDHGRISRQYAAALDLLREDRVRLPGQVAALAGRIVGPLTWGASVNDRSGKPVLQNEVLLDAVAKHLSLKAAWQEGVLRSRAPVSITLIEEQMLTGDGLAGLPFEQERALALLEDVLSGLTGLRGFHCRWPIDLSVLSTSANVLSLDVSGVTPAGDGEIGALREFLARGGTLVWCIAPDVDSIEEQSAERLAEHLQSWLSAVAADESILDALIAASIISIAPILDKASVASAERAMALTADVSRIMQERYG